MIRIGRRHFLGGAGAMIALPFLESLAQTTVAPARFIAFFVPNGIQMDQWTPDTTGNVWDLKRITRPILPVQSDVTLITGLANLVAASPAPGAHARGTGSFLTCVQIAKSEASEIGNGISVDQLMAKKQQTRFRSLQVGMDSGEAVGNCDSGYSCAYARNISWSGPTTPMPKVVEPRVLFERLFAGQDVSAAQQDRERREKRQASILDSVRGEITALSPRLGSKDRQKLDEYLTGVRELEERISRTAQICVADPISSTTEFPARVHQMLDLMVIAFRCDLTRVFSFMLGNSLSNRSHDFLPGARGAHHELSHHQKDPEKIEKLNTIATWEIEQFVTLVQKLKAVREGEGSLLDSSIVYLSSDVEDGNSHVHKNLPVLLAGRGGGLTSGVHLRFENDEPLANLYLSLLKAMGTPQASFGRDSTRQLPGLLV